MALAQKFSCVIKSSHYFLLGYNKLDKHWSFPGSVTRYSSILFINEIITKQTGLSISRRDYASVFDENDIKYYVIVLPYVILPPPLPVAFFSTLRWIHIDDLHLYPLDPTVATYFNIKSPATTQRIAVVVLTYDPNLMSINMLPAQGLYLLTVDRDRKYEIPFDFAHPSEVEAAVTSLLRNAFRLKFPNKLNTRKIHMIDTIYYIFRVPFIDITANYSSSIELINIKNVPKDTDPELLLLYNSALMPNLIGKRELNTLQTVYSIFESYDEPPDLLQAPLSPRILVNKINRAGTIIRDPSKQYILLVFDRRSKLWSVPKGSMERGETELETAIRETYEETGLQVQPDMLESGMKYKYYRLFNATLPMNVTFNPISVDEIAEVKWMSLAEFSDIPKSELMKRVFKYISRDGP